MIGGGSHPLIDAALALARRGLPFHIGGYVRLAIDPAWTRRIEAAADRRRSALRGRPWRPTGTPIRRRRAAAFIARRAGR